MTAVMSAPNPLGMNIDPGPAGGGDPATSDPAFYNWLIQSQGMDPGQLAGGSVPGIDSLYNNYEASVQSGGINPAQYAGGTETLGNAAAGSGGSYSNPGVNAITGQTVQPGGATGPTPAPGGGAQGSSASNPFFGNPAGAQPLPFSAFGSIPQIAPTFTQPATIDPGAAGTPGTGYDPYANPMMNAGMTSAFEQAVNASLDPTFQAQQQQQNEQMAARGIFNSSAAQDAQTQLQGTQSATLAGAYAPIIASAQSGAQQAASQNAGATSSADLSGFNAYEQNLLANQGAATGANQFNATAANQATAGNAATQLGIEQGDQSNYNAFEQALLGYGNQTGQAGYGAMLNSYSPAGSNILGAGATSAGNAATSALANYNGSGLSSGISNIFAGLGSAGKNSTPGFTSSVGDQTAFNINPNVADGTIS